MIKEAGKMVTRTEAPKRNTFVTGTVKDLIDIARIGNGDVGKVFNGKLTARDIGEEGATRTQFSIEISSQIPPKKERKGIVKQVVLEKFVGERENSNRETFEIFNIEMHKKRLDSKKRMEQISNLSHFEETRKLLLKGIGSTEWDLIGIENKLPGARGLSDQVEMKTSRINS